MPSYSLNHTACSCRLQCDLSVVYTADIPMSREWQELKTSRISVWVYVNHLIWFLFPLRYSFTYFHLCLVCCGQNLCICLWLFPSLAFGFFENFCSSLRTNIHKNIHQISLICHLFSQCCTAFTSFSLFFVDSHFCFMVYKVDLSESWHSEKQMWWDLNRADNLICWGLGSEYIFDNRCTTNMNHLKAICLALECKNF